LLFFFGLGVLSTLAAMPRSAITNMNLSVLSNENRKRRCVRAGYIPAGVMPDLICYDLSDLIWSDLV
jgi:hypothetical protein